MISFAALFVALGGTGYAALTVTGRSIKNGTLSGADIRNGSLQRRDLAPAARPGGRGKQGPAGPAGTAGLPGPRGADGPAGPQGAPGERGFPCDPAVYDEACRGPDGPQGMTGAAGPQGDAGAMGPIGPEGPQGPRGFQGAIGARGAKGDKGDPGQDGTTPRAWANADDEPFDSDNPPGDYTRVNILSVPAGTGRFLVTFSGQLTSLQAGVSAECHLFVDVAGSDEDVELGSRRAKSIADWPMIALQAHVDATDARFGTTHRLFWVGCDGSDESDDYRAISTLSAVEITN